MSDDNEEDGNFREVSTVAFDYIKGSHFRAVHVDGAIGGLTPNGHIHMAPYAERSAIPRRTHVELKDDGALGDIVELESRASIVRELEFDLFMDLTTAKSLRRWLDDRIEEAELRQSNAD